MLVKVAGDLAALGDVLLSDHDKALAIVWGAHRRLHACLRRNYHTLSAAGTATNRSADAIPSQHGLTIPLLDQSSR
jgi:hypothetical protein